VIFRNNLELSRNPYRRVLYVAYIELWELWGLVVLTRATYDYKVTHPPLVVCTGTRWFALLWDKMIRSLVEQDDSLSCVVGWLVLLWGLDWCVLHGDCSRIDVFSCEAWIDVFSCEAWIDVFSMAIVAGLMCSPVRPGLMCSPWRL